MKRILAIASLGAAVLSGLVGCAEAPTNSVASRPPVPIFMQSIHLSASASIVDSDQELVLRVTGEPRYTTTGMISVAGTPFGCLDGSSEVRWIMQKERVDTFMTNASAGYLGRIYVEKGKPMEWAIHTRLLSSTCSYKFAVGYRADSIWSAVKGAFIPINSPEAIEEYSLGRPFDPLVVQPPDEKVLVECR